MADYINWYEIPALDIERAGKFYGTVFGFEPQVIDNYAPNRYVFFPDNGGVFSHPDYKPSPDGVSVYIPLRTDDLDSVLSKVAEAGGEVILPKTTIPVGFKAMFKDTEGNKLGLFFNPKTISAEKIAPWFEIPATDINRAGQFYGTIFGFTPDPAHLSSDYFFLPGNGGIFKKPDFQPSSDSVLVYLDGGENLSTVLDKVEDSGGTVVIPKTEMSPNNFLAFFIDSEGNKLGLFSAN
jgi:uncharacterized protein